MIEPLEMYAHVPVLLRGYTRLEQATAKVHRLDKRVRALAELKAATLTHCEYCIDMGSQISRRWGLTDEELLALPSYRTSPLFTDIDKLILDYAVGMSRTPVDVPDALFAKLRTHFDDAQLVELTHLIALENLRSASSSSSVRPHRREICEPMSMQYSQCVSVAAFSSARARTRLSRRCTLAVACSSLV